jgi:hypothetical protein
MKARVALVGLLLSSATDAVPTQTVDFAEIEGTYVSSILGGCELQVRRDSSVSLSCRELPLCRARAIPAGRGFAILCGSTADARGSIVLAAQQPPNPRDWPPANRDPTKGPFRVYPPVFDQYRRSSPREFFWLEPVHWPPRLYLVRHPDMAAFCDAARTGSEPRRTAAGYHFLRQRDYLKQPKRKVPVECTGAQ